MRSMIVLAPLVLCLIWCLYICNGNVLSFVTYMGRRRSFTNDLVKNYRSSSNKDLGNFSDFCADLKVKYLQKYEEIVFNFCFVNDVTKQLICEDFKRDILSVCPDLAARELVEGYCSELMEDINTEPSNDQKTELLLKFKQYSKKILIQILLLGINFAQVEMNRYLAHRAVEQRLIEIPEFPLL